MRNMANVSQRWKAYGDNRDEDGAMDNGVSLLEHRRNEEILVEAKVEAIAAVMRRRRLEWFGHVKRRGVTENIRAVAEMKMEGKRPRGRPRLRWNDTVRRDLNAWNIKEEWATDRERWKGLCKTRYPEQGDGGERWESCSCKLHHQSHLKHYWKTGTAILWARNEKDGAKKKIMQGMIEDMMTSKK